MPPLLSPYLHNNLTTALGIRESKAERRRLLVADLSIRSITAPKASLAIITPRAPPIIGARKAASCMMIHWQTWHRGTPALVNEAISSCVPCKSAVLHQTGSGEMAAAAKLLHLVTPPPGPCSCSGRARQTAVWCFIRGLHDIIISSESRVAWLLGVKLRQVTTGGGAEAGVQLRGARRTRRTAAAGERDTGRHLAGVLYSVRCVQCTVHAGQLIYWGRGSVAGKQRPQSVNQRQYSPRKHKQ